jgi:hypothetical protein
MNTERLRGLALVLGVIGCNSDKRVANALLKQYYECVTVTGPAATEALQENARLKACLMSKGWNSDSASAISGGLSDVLVAGLTETAKNGKAAGDSAMRAEGDKRVKLARVESMKSGLRDLVTAEERYWADSLKYTTTVDCSSRSRGAILCVAEDNVLGPIRLTKDGWTATMTNSKLPGVTCVIFIGSTPVAPATTEGQVVCQ